MLEIKIKSEEKSYPILIENEDISSLCEKIFSGLESYLVVISAKVEKLYGKELNIPKNRKKRKISPITKKSLSAH